MLLILGCTGAGAYEPNDWPVAGGDLANTRYSTLSEVNRQNVGRLRGAWVTSLNAAGTSSAIVVANKHMVVTAGPAVYEVDPADGHILWSFKPPAPPSKKGVAVGGGRIYVGLSNADLVALDESTGELLWSVAVGEKGWNGVKLGKAPSQPIGQLNLAAGQYISAPPTYWDGMVIVGLANGDYGVRGRIVCVDAASGKLLWQFFSVPEPGAPGSETWPPNTELWKTGGGGVWMNAAIDPGLGLVYVGIGNPVPQWGGEIRPGDNLFTDCVVALDIVTGKLRWYFQAVHHDIWDQDLGTPLILYEGRNGDAHGGLGVMRTDGYLFQLDRETGKPLRPIRERRVPHNARLRMSPTQPFPVGTDAIGPRCVQRDKSPPGFRRRCYFDTLDGAPNLLFPLMTTRAAPMSFSRQTGFFYITAGVGASWLRRSDDPYFEWMSTPAGLKSYGLIAAIDSHSGKIVWQNHLAQRADGGGGTMSTAGGLVFYGDLSGRLRAYDASNGRLLWSFQTGMPIEGPVSTYQANGEQYIAVAARDLWAFKLDGPLPARADPIARLTQLSNAAKAEVLGPIIRTDTIEIAASITDVATTGTHELFDEYAVRPVRSRIGRSGVVTFINRGRAAHTITARDGRWSTGSIAPKKSKTIVLSKPGRYMFFCEQHPWSIGELTVGDESESPQADRGEGLYQTHCAICHRSDLGGREPAPPLMNWGFTQVWGGRSAGDLYDAIRKTMPMGRPGSLSDQQYADIVEFILSANDTASRAAEFIPASAESRAQLIPH